MTPEASAIGISREALFQPLTLRGVTLPNRIVMLPMTRKRSPAGVPGENVAAYYARRAAGGAGLIITEGAGVDHPAAVDHPSIPVLHGAAALQGWRIVVERVHAAGGKIFPQLWHQGVLRNPLDAANPELEPMRPSGRWGTVGFCTISPEVIELSTPDRRAMTEEEVADVIDAFGRTARNCMSVGFDGIAIHGAHGYLIDTFLWADTNHRKDRWGGTAAARARFGAEVVRAIRRAVGERTPIMFRFSQHKSQDYDARIAATPAELGIILGALSDAGVDVFDASIRRFNRLPFDGSNLTLAGWARKLTGKPSMAVGGVGLNNWSQETLRNWSPTEAVDNVDEILALFAEGQFDLVGIGRALLGDPQWPIKMRRGEAFQAFNRQALVDYE